MAIPDFQITMAIHVRSTRRAAGLWRQWRIRLARFAVAVALVTLLFCGCIMYLVRIFNPPEPATSFISWQEPGNEHAETETEEPSAPSGAVRPAQVNVTPVIIAMTDAVPLPDEVNLDLESFEDELVDASIDVGIGGGDFRGDGGGESGGRSGGRGSGRKKGSGGAMGYNDDVQVLLALDASGSMDRLFQAVADSLEELLRTLGECRLNGQPASVSVGIVVYGQNADDGKPFELTPFSLELKEMHAKVKSVNCDGVHENCGEAIAFALKHYPWNRRKRKQLLRVLFVAGNESFDQGPVNYRDALETARKMGVIVNTIHCGAPNPEWRAAALLGGGAGLTFDMREAESAHSKPQQSRGELIEALYGMKVFPLGSPAEQAALREELSKRPPLPDLSDARAVRDWSRENLAALLQGSHRDAVELCRRLGADCSLDALGGWGNLPPELRQLGDEEQILGTVSLLARERQQLIDGLCTRDNSTFIGKVLETLIQQAAERGIDITR